MFHGKFRIKIKFQVEQINYYTCICAISIMCFLHIHLQNGHWINRLGFPYFDIDLDLGISRSNSKSPIS